MNEVYEPDLECHEKKVWASGAYDNDSFYAEYSKEIWGPKSEWREAMIEQLSYQLLTEYEKVCDIACDDRMDSSWIDSEFDVVAKCMFDDFESETGISLSEKEKDKIKEDV